MRHTGSTGGLRIISLLLLLSFPLQDIAYASPDFARPAQGPAIDPARLSFESDIARVTAAYQGSDERLLIHIQDAHTNVSAQENIAKVLEELIRRYKLKTIFLEGGTQDDSLSFLRPLAPAEIRARVAKKYLLRGEINGAEYLNIISDYDMQLWGVEDGDLYRQNLSNYAKAVVKRDKALSYLTGIERRLDSLRDKRYPADLAELDRLMESFEAQETEFTEFYGALRLAADRYGVNLTGFPNFFSLKNLTELEARIDFKEANRQQDRLAQRLVSGLSGEELPDAIQKLHSGSATPLGFYKDLLERARKAGVPQSECGELAEYAAYLEAYAGIDMHVLVEEIAEIRKAVFRSALQESEDYYLFELTEHTRSLKEMLQLKIGSDRFGAYEAESRLPRFQTAVNVGFINRELDDWARYSEIMPYDSVLEDNRGSAEDFYRVNEKRDGVMIDKALQKMSRDHLRVAVLITGGYHTDNLTSLLRRRGVSYAVVTPNIHRQTNLERYEKLLLSQLGSDNPLQQRRVVSGKDYGMAIVPFIQRSEGTIGGVTGRAAARLAQELQQQSGSAPEQAPSGVTVTEPSPVEWKTTADKMVTAYGQLSKEDRDVFAVLAEIVLKQGPSADFQTYAEDYKQEIAYRLGSDVGLPQVVRVLEGLGLIMFDHGFLLQRAYDGSNFSDALWALLSGNAGLVAEDLVSAQGRTELYIKHTSYLPPPLRQKARETLLTAVLRARPRLLKPKESQSSSPKQEESSNSDDPLIRIAYAPTLSQLVVDDKDPSRSPDLPRTYLGNLLILRRLLGLKQTQISAESIKPVLDKLPSAADPQSPLQKLLTAFQQTETKSLALILTEDLAGMALERKEQLIQIIDETVIARLSTPAGEIEKFTEGSNHKFNISLMSLLKPVFIDRDDYKPELFKLLGKANHEDLYLLLRNIRVDWNQTGDYSDLLREIRWTLAPDLAFAAALKELRQISDKANQDAVLKLLRKAVNNPDAVLDPQVSFNARRIAVAFGEPTVKGLHQLLLHLQQSDSAREVLGALPTGARLPNVAVFEAISRIQTIGALNRLENILNGTASLSEDMSEQPREEIRLAFNARTFEDLKGILDGISNDRDVSESAIRMIGARREEISEEMREEKDASAATGPRLAPDPATEGSAINAPQEGAKSVSGAQLVAASPEIKSMAEGQYSNFFDKLSSYELDVITALAKMGLHPKSGAALPETETYLSTEEWRVAARQALSPDMDKDEANRLIDSAIQRLTNLNLVSFEKTPLGDHSYDGLSEADVLWALLSGQVMLMQDDLRTHLGTDFTTRQDVISTVVAKLTTFTSPDVNVDKEVVDRINAALKEYNGMQSLIPTAERGEDPTWLMDNASAFTIRLLEGERNRGGRTGARLAAQDERVAQFANHVASAERGSRSGARPEGTRFYPYLLRQILVMVSLVFNDSGVSMSAGVPQHPADPTKYAVVSSLPPVGPIPYSSAPQLQRAAARLASQPVQTPDFDPKTLLEALGNSNPALSEWAFWKNDMGSNHWNALNAVLKKALDQSPGSIVSLAFPIDAFFDIKTGNIVSVDLKETVGMLNVMGRARGVSFEIFLTYREPELIKMSGAPDNLIQKSINNLSEGLSNVKLNTLYILERQSILGGVLFSDKNRQLATQGPVIIGARSNEMKYPEDIIGGDSFRADIQSLGFKAPVGVIGVQVSEDPNNVMIVPAAALISAGIRAISPNTPISDGLSGFFEEKDVEGLGRIIMVKAFPIGARLGGLLTSLRATQSAA